MILENSMFFEQAAQELFPHLAHTLSIMAVGGDAAPESIAIDCEDCHTVLIEFLPESDVSSRPDPDQVKYEGHYDDGLDLCYVEVFKPGKSPYPLQERQDIINHSPTGIAWGYGGSGPAQCAFAVLMDYLCDEAQARALYQDFKFRVIAKLPPNSQWTLTGRQIESAIFKLTHHQKQS